MWFASCGSTLSSVVSLDTSSTLFLCVAERRRMSRLLAHTRVAALLRIARTLIICFFGMPRALISSSSMSCVRSVASPNQTLAAPSAHPNHWDGRRCNPVVVGSSTSCASTDFDISTPHPSDHASCSRCGCLCTCVSMRHTSSSFVSFCVTCLGFACRRGGIATPCWQTGLPRVVVVVRLYDCVSVACYDLVS